MGSYGKFILCLAVAVCVIQAVNARPQMDGAFLENVKYDLMRKCMSVERDIEKEVMNTKHKVVKESGKMMKKATKEGAAECVESARMQSEDQLEEKTQELQECVNNLKESLESGLPEESTLREILTFRNDFKKNLSVCKSTGKLELKKIQNEFSVAGKRCLI